MHKPLHLPRPLIHRNPPHSTPQPLAISLDHFYVRYGQKIVLEGEKLRIIKNSRTAIVGPNGAGKSSLLKALLQIIPLHFKTNGAASILGLPFPLKKRKDKIRVAYLPQDQQLDLTFPISAWDVAFMGCYGELGWWKRPRPEHRSLTLDALTQMGVANLAHLPFGHLSGGQRQRVLLARALIQKSDLFLMDEPLTGVDSGTAAHLKTTWLALSQAGKTIVAVHHDLSSLQNYFSHVIVLKQTILYAGPLSPATKNLLRDALKEAYSAYQMNF